MPTLPVSAPSPAFRNQTADLLKGIAVVLMIQVHIVEQFANVEVFDGFPGRVALFLGGPPAAPVFLSIMGYFLALSKKPFSRQIRRGALLITGGLMLNVGLNMNLLVSIQQGRFAVDPLALLFGADILPLAGLSVIVIALLRRFNNDGEFYFALAFLVVLLKPLFPAIPADSVPVVKFASAFFWGNLWWSYFPVFPWLAYVLLGFAFGLPSELRSMMASLTDIWKRWILVVLFALVLCFFPEALLSITDLHTYYHHDADLAAWIAAFLLCWLLVVSGLEHRYGSLSGLRYLKWLGRNVTAVYVFQWIIIGNMATVLYRTQSGLQSAAWFAFVLVLTSLVIALLDIFKRRLRLHPSG